MFHNKQVVLGSFHLFGLRRLCLLTKIPTICILITMLALICYQGPVSSQLQCSVDVIPEHLVVQLELLMYPQYQVSGQAGEELFEFSTLACGGSTASVLPWNRCLTVEASLLPEIGKVIGTSFQLHYDVV